MTRFRAGGDNDVFRADDFFFTCFVRHFNLRRSVCLPHERTVALEQSDFVLFKQVLNTAGHFVHDRIFTRDHFTDIQRCAFNRNAMFAQVMRSILVVMRAGQ